MGSPRRTLVWCIPLLVAGFLGVTMILGLEKFDLYLPVRTIEATPHAEGVAYEDVWFPASDGMRLHGWLVPAPDARITILWFHGNAGNISHRVTNIKYLHQLLHVNVFIFDYRGYGRSAGHRFDLSEPATYRDGEGAVAYLRSRKDLASTRLVYFGRSLGAAVALELARREPPAGLILETAFTSIAEMARIVAPFLPFPGLLRTKYDNLAKIPAVRVPLLMLHGDQDDIVPFSLGRRLFEAANPPKSFYAVPGAHHNDIYIVGGEPYFQAWGRFLKGLE